MALSNKVKEKISIEVIKTLVARFETFPEDASKNRNAPLHESFLKAFSDKIEGKVTDTPFLISLSSWLHGLNTTLGQSFFENVAHHLCEGEKREYTSKKSGNLQITQTQKDNISKIITSLSNSIDKPDLCRENALIYKNYDTPLVNALDFSADVFIEDDASIIAIELKTVRPNSGEVRGEKQKILEGKAALYRKFSNRQIQFYIGFPFDPTADPAIESISSFDKKRFLGSIVNMNKYFDYDETLIANELWDFLSDQPNTMEQILEIINTISTTEFLHKFQYLNDNDNRLRPEYLEALNCWHLYSEKELVENSQLIRQKINSDKKLKRVYNKTAFDNKGNYNFERYNELKKLLPLSIG